MMVHACNSSYLEGTDRRIMVGGQLMQSKHETVFENKLKTKGLGMWLKW
jgi:hypothetical protein